MRMIDSAPMTRRAALILACAALLAGCGGGDGNDEPNAREAAQAYVDAYNARDFQRVCELLSDSYKQQLKAPSCPAYFEEQSSGATTTLTLVDVQQNDDLATAHIRSQSEDSSGNETAGFVRQQDGSWKLESVTGFYAKQP
jgi:ketosteroid isomerase-like protein